MCYSLKSSIIAFTIAITTSYILYKRNLPYDKLLFPFIISYALMQFAEALMWYDYKCGKINILGNYIAYISLIIQTLGLGIGIYLLNKQYYGIIIGIIVILYFLYNMPIIKCSTIKNNLDWGFNGEFYIYIYFICIFLALSLIITNSINPLHIILIIIWFTVSYLYFFKNKYDITLFIKNLLLNKFNISTDTNEIASQWCHTTSFFAPLLYFIPYVKF